MENQVKPNPGIIWEVTWGPKKYVLCPPPVPEFASGICPLTGIPGGQIIWGHNTNKFVLRPRYSSWDAENPLVPNFLVLCPLDSGICPGTCPLQTRR